MEHLFSTVSSSDNREHYSPPLLGNGDLSIQLDVEGAQRQVEHCQQMLPGIYRAGHRYFMPGHPLVHFGFLTQSINGSTGLPEAWSQSLDITHGIMHSSCRYAGGVTVETDAFCPFGRPVLYMRKRIHGASGGALPKLQLNYTLPAHRRNRVAVDGNALVYDIDGLENYCGRIALSATSGTVTAETGSLTASTFCNEVDFCLSFEDCPADIPYEQAVEAHISDWDAYWREGFIDIPSPSLMRLYYTAQYHLRITSTRWGLPTGILPLHWQGRYFAFDELFTFTALLGSGHFSTAEKIPDFRYRTLSAACQRSSDSLNRAKAIDKSAHYPWESLENGGEGAPDGYWMDHIFHQAHAGICAAEYGLISGNTAFLREKGWPVIRAVVAFYLQGWIYRNPDNRLIIGKCTDLERLGAYQEQALMTTSAVIRLLRLGSRVAKLLNETAQELDNWETIADELENNLPQDGEKYLSCLHADQRSIAITMATAMYHVLDPTTALTKNALADADAHQSDFAHQYYSGGRIMSTWYSGLMAKVLVLQGKTAEAIRLLEEATQATGAFGECFEVYEHSLRPWFSTASGAVIDAINAILLTAAESNSALPKIWSRFSCHIAGQHGGMLTISCDNQSVHISEN